jgi:hypothetical protein
MACCPGGLCPEEVSQTCLILAATGAGTDETSIATDSATAIAASAANVTLFVLISVMILPIMKIKKRF